MDLSKLPRQRATAKADRRWRFLEGLGFAAQAAIVAGVVAAVWLGLAPLAYGLGGRAGLESLGTAAAVAVVASQLGLAVSHLARGVQAPMYGMLGGMMTRMAITLAAVVALQAAAAPVVDVPLVLYLMLFYLATLAAETVLLIARVLPRTTAPNTI